MYKIKDKGKKTKECEDVGMRSEAESAGWRMGMRSEAESAGWRMEMWEFIN
ncbi:MAG: hypothetical protein IPH88_19860 [Bacteroidales bacterium]|nr:hypothetical protein [Bacteroidales bacterium]